MAHGMAFAIIWRVSFFHIVVGGWANYLPPYPGIPVRDPLDGDLVSVPNRNACNIMGSQFGNISVPQTYMRRIIKSEEADIVRKEKI